MWWLSAGRGCIIPPSALGALHVSLLLEWYRQLEEGWTLSSTVDEVSYADYEDMIKRRLVCI